MTIASETGSVASTTADVGLFIDRFASGNLLSRRAAFAALPGCFGTLGVVASVVFILSGGSDRATGLQLLPIATALLMVGVIIGWLLHRHDIKHADDPRPLVGVMVSGGRAEWGTMLARFGAASRDGTIPIRELQVGSRSPADERRQRLTITIIPTGDKAKDFFVYGIGLHAGSESVGEVTNDDHGVMYLLSGTSATPLYGADEAERNNMSRTCVRNLRRIGAALSQQPHDCAVRVVIRSPKEGLGLGIAFGLLGAVVAAGLDTASLNKIRRLVDQGGLRDSVGDLYELLTSLGWELEVR